MYSPSSQIIASPNALVRIDRLAIDEVGLTDWRVAMALRSWQVDPHDTAAETFLVNMRRLVAPDPAHLTDTSPNDLPDWRIVNFCRHPFVMDGAEHTNTAIGAIREQPVQIAASETYAQVVRDGLPACFLVNMSTRVYQRSMFPFFGNSKPSLLAQGRVRLVPPMRVTKVVTIIRPLVQRSTLAEVIASSTPLRAAEIG